MPQQASNLPQARTGTCCPAAQRGERSTSSRYDLSIWVRKAPDAAALPVRAIKVSRNALGDAPQAPFEQVSCSQGNLKCVEMRVVPMERVCAPPCNGKIFLCDEVHLLHENIEWKSLVAIFDLRAASAVVGRAPTAPWSATCPGPCSRPCCRPSRQPRPGPW
jgi:hypothetical protein